MMIKILIAEKFSKTPFGRFASDSPNSAERFRKEHLVPAFQGKEQDVEIDFSGISLGIGSSFLEEAFGGLVRKEGLSKERIMRNLRIKSPLPIYEQQIKKFVENAKPEIGKVR
ncbi:STAS-like domain-containing protein [Pectobacterium carotovorum]|uniref:STAS-like domain-containing protein n=1 Tax=Pectobacterium carotovorum TaxID=554 RepID=UPI0038734355